MTEPALPPAPNVCGRCGTRIASALRACPACGRLVHADQLTKLSAEARAAAQRDDPATALSAWRDALDLLPVDSDQYKAVAQRVDELGRQVERLPAAARQPARREETPDSDATTPAGSPPSASGAKKGLMGLGAIGLVLWKFKFVLGFLITKGKLLITGLLKGKTLLTMILSFGVYWTAWGWKFALGLVVSIYIHEMGHVAALNRLGIRATAPMFIPGLGAMIRLKQYPRTPREDARVGLAGPVWGLGATLLALAIYHLTGWGSFAAIARCGAWINLFNLIPVWQLDGSRGFRALSRKQRWLAVAVIGGMWYYTAEGLLVLLLAVALFRAAGGKVDSPEGNRRAFAEYALLVVALSLLSVITVPGIQP